MKTVTASMALSASVLLATSLSTFAADDKQLPAQQVIAAIQSAVKHTPGQVKEIEVDKKDGKVVIEVTVVGADGRDKEIVVNPENNQVIQ